MSSLVISHQLLSELPKDVNRKHLGWKFLIALDSSGKLFHSSDLFVKTTLGALGRRRVIKICSNHDFSEWEIGKWREIGDSNVYPCVRGFHCSKTPREAFHYVRESVCALVEYGGKVKADNINCYKLAASKMRILRAWFVDYELQRRIEFEYPVPNGGAVLPPRQTWEMIFADLAKSKELR